MELNVVWDEHGERFEPWRDVLEVCKVLPSWKAAMNVGWNSSYKTWECTSSATEMVHCVWPSCRGESTTR